MQLLADDAIQMGPHWAQVQNQAEAYRAMRPAVQALCALTIAADHLAVVFDDYGDDDSDLVALRNVINLATDEARKIVDAYR